MSTGELDQQIMSLERPHPSLWKYYIIRAGLGDYEEIIRERVQPDASTEVLAALRAVYVEAQALHNSIRTKA